VRRVLIFDATFDKSAVYAQPVHGGRAARVLNPVELERRRLQAADLFEQGLRQVRVAEALGVTRQAFSLWHKRWLPRTAGTTSGGRWPASGG
jgi:hypothetical protein